MLLPGRGNELGLRLGSCKYGYLGEFCTGGNESAWCGTIARDMFSVSFACTRWPSLFWLVFSNRALLQLNIVDETGTVSWIATGKDWVLSRSPVTADHFYNGETYDARINSCA
jgi:hypothetical protein